MISPLTSIMMDQAAKFSPRGLATDFVGEAQMDSAATKRVVDGHAQLVFISPESIVTNPRFRNMLLSARYREKLVAVAVDEAHCVSKWGDKFRVAFARIGDLRSLVPTNVKMLVLTATATPETVRVVSERLSMKNVVVVALPPNRPNIMYKVQPLQNLEHFTTSLSTDLRRRGIAFPKTVIFCQKYTDCAQLYLVIRKKLGSAFTHPCGYPDLPQFRLVDLYTRVSTVHMRESILNTFTKSGSTLRLLVSTTAFGMGVDCRDIRTIIHWGVPADVEQYVQETGRAGRDGIQAEAVLHNGKIGIHTSLGMRNYVENTSVCRRVLLLGNFLLYSNDNISKCKCCDLCSQICTCITCSPAPDI